MAGPEGKLSADYYRKDDVVALARDLIGKTLCTAVDGVLTKGIITETEAYAGVTDKASHAFGGRRTRRTETMYETGGIAYVYLCYGIHHLFNVVTNVKDVPHAVLIRAIQPVHGIDRMKIRRNVKPGRPLTSGPGTLSQAMGITTKLDGTDLTGSTVWIENGIDIAPERIYVSPRIGVDYAGEDARLPYRFFVNESVI